MNCLEILIKKLEIKYAHFKEIGPYLHDRQKDILQFIKQNEPTKVGDIARNFESYSIHSIKKDLIYLYKENLIDKVGKGKGTVYIMNRSGDTY